MGSTDAGGSSGQGPNGSIFSISGPVIVAEHMIGCAMYELVSQARGNQKFCPS